LEIIVVVLVYYSGALVRKFDKENKGYVNCAKFTTQFLKLGQEQRSKRHTSQLERQRQLIIDAGMDESVLVISRCFMTGLLCVGNVYTEADHQRRMKETQESKTFRIDYDFSDADMQSALSKLLVASTNYDTVRGVSLDSFEPESLGPQLFTEALQRTFNVFLTPAELGAMMVTFDKQGKGKVHCKTFLNSFMSFGLKERDRVRDA
jgi:hypothetical protein